MQIGAPVPLVWVMFDGARCSFDHTSATYDCLIVGESTSISIAELLGVPIGGVAPCADGTHLLIFEYDDSGSPFTITNWHLVAYSGSGIVQVIDTGTFTASGDTQKLNVGLGPIHVTNGHFQTCMMESDLRHVWRTTGSNVELWTIDRVTGVMALDLATISGGFGGTTITDVVAGTPFTIHAENGFCAIVAGDDTPPGHWVYVYSRLPAITSDAIILGDIVSALCERVGLTSDQLDVSDLTTEVRGFLHQFRNECSSGDRSLDACL